MSMTDWNSQCALAENEVVSEVKFDKASLVWTINNFDYSKVTELDIESPIFTAPTNHKVKWFITLNPDADFVGRGTTHYISFVLYLSDESEVKEVFAKSSFSMFDKNGKRSLFKNVDFCEFNICKGFDDGCQFNFKIDEKFREEFLSKNSLRIHCEVMFPRQKDGHFEHRQCGSALFPNSASAKYDSTSFLDILLKSHLLSDVIISVKTKEFPAHKAILAVRSKVFAAMFQHDTKEKHLNRVLIKDMDEEVFGEMLQYIYTGKCEKLDEFVEELLAAADKYDLNGLKIICSEMLYKNLSVENAAQNLIIADMHNATEMKNEVIKFILDKSTEVFDSVGWINVLNNPRLIDQVFRASVRR